MSYTRNITINVKRKLYLKSGSLCTICGYNLDKDVYIGEICHIEAVNSDGARYNPNLDNAYINSYENLLLLCPTCHKMIDKDESNYPVQKLKELKHKHEQRIENINSDHLAIKPPKSYDELKCTDLPAEMIIQKYQNIYYDNLKLSCIENTLHSLDELEKNTRSILYGIIISCDCGLSSSEAIDIHQLFNMCKQNINIDLFADVLKNLEDLSFIEGNICRCEWEGFETEDGDFVFYKDDYRSKIFKGDWCLQKKEKILLTIKTILQSDKKLYDFIVEGEGYI